MRKPSVAPLSTIRDPLITFCGLLAAFYLLWRSASTGGTPTGQVVFWIGAALLAGAGGWIVYRWQGATREREGLRQELQSIQGQVPAAQRRLEAVMRLNCSLIDAQDEKALMDSALPVIADLLNASAVTFVPMDEWGQPLTAFTYGDFPEPILKAWAEHLATERVRLRCEQCERRIALPDTACPILEGPFARTVTIHCMPLMRGERMLGMLNVHLPVDAEFRADDQEFLEGLLYEIALAVQTIRLRNQELATLRQLQMLRASKADLSALLNNLLDGLQRALNADFVLLTVIHMDAWQTGMQLQRGFSPWPESKTVEKINAKVLSSHQPFPALPGGASTPDLELTELAVPLILPGGQVAGSLLVAGKRPLNFGERELDILQNTAAQLALLIENERMFLSLEYNAVIQERIRLAREIHDGLAQTLAFLKMKTSQMQSYLSQGDMPRLSQALQQNYQALAEAYLDTRQAIDNLRLTPQPGLTHWLDQLLSEFETGSGVPVERHTEIEAELPPEVQAQLIRILQETLSNIRKHAHAQRVWVSLREWEGDLILEVGDDGQGFDPAEMPELSQYGLRGIRERAEFIGADIQITSHPHQGTVVRLRLPRYEETLK